MRRQTESRQEAVVGAEPDIGGATALREGEIGVPPARLAPPGRLTLGETAAMPGAGPHRPPAHAGARRPALRLTRRRVPPIMRQKPRPGTGSPQGPEPIERSRA